MARRKDGDRRCWMKSRHISPDGIPGVFANLPRCHEAQFFLKRKKQFAKGRTIISYAQSLRSKLLEMASIALTVIAKTLYSDSPGMQSMPQLWKSLHRHWARPSEEHDVEWNDDLNAVPRKDILRSVHTRVREYQQHTGCSVLSLDLLSKTGHPGNPRGRTKSRSQPSLNYRFQQGCSQRPAGVVCRSKEPALAAKFPPSFQACRC